MGITEQAKQLQRKLKIKKEKQLQIGDWRGSEKAIKIIVLLEKRKINKILNKLK